MAGIGKVYTSHQDYTLTRQCSTAVIEQGGSTVEFEKHELPALIEMLQRVYDDACEYYAERDFSKVGQDTEAR